MANSHSLPDYVASLELHGSVPQPAAASASAVVAGASVVSFVAGVSQQNREDVLNSTLLMQLAANKAFNQATQRDQWFRFYTNGLQRLGWTVGGSALEEYQTHGQSFTLDEVALDIITDLSGGSEFAPVAQRSLDALRHQSQPLRLFEHCSSSGNVGTFQVLPCIQTPDGGVAMLMNCLQLVRNASNTHVLFLTFQRHEVRIFRSAQIAVLDEQVYSLARDAVLEKLGHGASQFLANLAI